MGPRFDDSAKGALSNALERGVPCAESPSHAINLNNRGFGMVNQTRPAQAGPSTKTEPRGAAVNIGQQSQRASLTLALEGHATENGCRTPRRAISSDPDNISRLHHNRRGSESERIAEINETAHRIRNRDVPHSALCHRRAESQG